MKRLSVFLAFSFFSLVSSASFAQKIRLPEEFSEHQPTILPVLTSDGKRIYFDRKNFSGNVGGVNDFDDIWFSDLEEIKGEKSSRYKSESGVWSKAKNMGRPLNTEGSDVLCSLSPDDRQALVYGIYDRDLPVKNEGFSITRFSNGSWQFPQPITIQNFYNRTKKYYAQLAPDNRTLLLALQRDESLGGLDLYVSFRQDTSLIWSAPLHLGKSLNTDKYEGSPHLAADGKTLYFSSEGLGGSGVADLFVTRRLDDSWQRWSPPQNLGSLINTGEEDSSIDVTLDGTTAYFLSSDSLGKKGLYKAALPDSLRNQGAVLLSGQVSLEKKLEKKRSDADLREMPIFLTLYGAAQEVPNDARSMNPAGSNSAETRSFLVSLAETTLADKDYAMALPQGGIYLLKAALPESAAIPSYLEVIDARKQSPQCAALLLEKRLLNITLGSERSPDLTFPPIRFKQEQAVMVAESAELPTLIAFAYKALNDEILRNNVQRISNQASGKIMIEITGHTCDLGTHEENDALGQERAEAVAAVLEANGVPHDAMIVSSKGERKPLQKSQFEEARQLNRRVDVRIYRSGK